ncbi:FecCD family ABC transporter permease [Spirilliplanes yamanashiensis]|uniref:ABC transporter permease n=1 Tax=Spirilliplanes yamanashiensis TaxID=42233 RepID=A0A8J3Y6H9_9ACTN|nr:iron chelate uptake ABC transporter family permease subunit [Spirilliplanes yamanashiensis]MDP9814765.1 iron complex transport system permease protein [Spirilliplanes yamanashiensis]GIJ02419.1 ABC transporter permease [Spirilliplanes yamanashiensis]
MTAVRLGSLSARVTPRAVTVGAVLALVAAGTAVVSLTIGDYALTVPEVLRTLTGGGTRAGEFAVYSLRLPRVLTALLVGMAFGVAGALFQNLSRNPLGSPDIIGFTTGSATGALIGVILLGGGTAVVGGGAVVGGLAAAVLVYVLAVHRGVVRPHQLVLVGIGVSAVLASVNGYLLTRARLGDAMQAAVWLTGSLNGRGWEHVVPVGVAVAVLVPLLLVLARPLSTLALGDDTASALGVPVERTRRGLLIAAVALTAVATASAGPVPFVALAAPQVARRLTGSAGANLVTAGLTGAALLALADLGAQRLLAPTQLPVGVLTGALGGVYLVWLLASRRRTGRW